MQDRLVETTHSCKFGLDLDEKAGNHMSTTGYAYHISTVRTNMQGIWVTAQAVQDTEDMCRQERAAE